MKIGITAGNFDVLHPGYIKMFKEAKQHCDYLIVGIQIDPSVDRKEKNKPVQSIIERQIQVGGCRFVDETIVYATEKDLIILLQTLPVDVRFLGSEYQVTTFTGSDLPIEIVFNRREHTFSSTALRDRVFLAENGKHT